MHRKIPFVCVFLMLFFSVPVLSGCSSGSSSPEDSSGNHGEAAASESRPDAAPTEAQAKTRRITQYEYLVPEASGNVTFGSEEISIDASNTGEGYVMVRYQGSSDKVKLQLKEPDGTVYTYTLSQDGYEAFPLSGGDGNYHLDILEHAYDEMYALAMSQDIDVTLNDEFRPFLYANQYVWFTGDYQAVKYGAELSEGSSSDLDYVEQVYLYVTENIRYDDQLAESVESGYLPDIDETLSTKKGICFDYAALTAAMLRSQKIPTRLEVGYAGEAYHAWISCYVEETGWIDNIIEFDGSSWSLMDPTFAASTNSRDLKQFIGDGSNYAVKYYY